MIETYEEYLMPGMPFYWIVREDDDWAFYDLNLEPNEPNVLECKDKMINEI